MLNNLLAYRLLLLNVMFGVVVTWAAAQGYVAELFLKDTTYITAAIAGVFSIGMASLFMRARRVTKILNGLKKGIASDLNMVKFRIKSEHLDDISSWLVTLGLLGTVIGFAMAISGLDQSAMSTASGVQQSIGKLMEGMTVAIYTTIVGAFLGFWFDMNRRILKTATGVMMEDNFTTYAEGQAKE